MMSLSLFAGRAVITGDFNLSYLNNTSRRKIDSLCMHFYLTNLSLNQLTLLNILLVW